VTDPQSKLAVRATARVFHQLHRRGIIRAINSESSNSENSPVTMRFEAWPRVPAWAVGHFADHHFAQTLYSSKASTYYRKSIDCGPVTVSRRRVWVIRYASSTGTLADAFKAFR